MGEGWESRTVIDSLHLSLSSAYVGRGREIKNYFNIFEAQIFL